MRLEKFLHETGQTARNFSINLGVAPSTISRVIAGIRKPSRDLIIRILGATDGKVGFEDLANIPANHAPRKRRGRPSVPKKVA